LHQNYEGMKITLKRLFVLSIFMLVVACRVTPQEDSLGGENISSNEPVSIKINLSSAEWNSDINENPLIAENNQPNTEFNTSFR